MLSEFCVMEILIHDDEFPRAGGSQRYDSQTRWPGVLQQKLGQGYEVIEEGL